MTEAEVSLTGDRLEVMWELELDGESVRKWWPCTLDRRGDGTLTEAGQHVFALTYDAFGEFDVCTRRVTFQAPHCLHDIEEGVGMRFRREGEQLPGDEEEEEEGEEDEEGDELVAPGDHIVDLDELVGQDGGSDQPLLAGMQHLPMVQQQNIALAMRGMMDAFKEKLREHMSAKPSGSEDADVVTRDDVRTILEDLGRQRHTQEIADGA
ncbi:hypothetical protein JKP88DRAFT_348970 [Tribonema minus]|uniref:Uncharacterized protein n=1 Tax=Tribonema minus TaxID=303371 RepID=A0A835YVR0_9STRA|nr:hypothetical protein JKP88DRAFT_348970 [Tribonema minus]